MSIQNDNTFKLLHGGWHDVHKFGTDTTHTCTRTVRVFTGNPVVLFTQNTYQKTISSSHDIKEPILQLYIASRPCSTINLKCSVDVTGADCSHNRMPSSQLKTMLNVSNKNASSDKHLWLEKTLPEHGMCYVYSTAFFKKVVFSNQKSAKRTIVF